MSLVGLALEKTIRSGTFEVINVLPTTVEVVRDLSALMVEAEVLLTLNSIEYMTKIIIGQRD